MKLIGYGTAVLHVIRDISILQVFTITENMNVIQLLNSIVNTATNNSNRKATSELTLHVYIMLI